MLAVTERLGLRRLHHHFLGAYLVNSSAPAPAPDELVGRARRLLVEDPLFRNRAQVELVLAIGLVDRGDFAGAQGGARGRSPVRPQRRGPLPPLRRGRRAGLGDGDRPALNGALDELARAPVGSSG